MPGTFDKLGLCPKSLTHSLVKYQVGRDMSMVYAKQGTKNRTWSLSYVGLRMNVRISVPPIPMQLAASENKLK